MHLLHGEGPGFLGDGAVTKLTLVSQASCPAKFILIHVNHNFFPQVQLLYTVVESRLCEVKLMDSIAGRLLVYLSLVLTRRAPMALLMNKVANGGVLIPLVPVSTVASHPPSQATTVPLTVTLQRNY